MSTNSLLRRNLSLALPTTSPLPPPPPLLSSYDVFLSFRGEDVRGKFIDHLYARLQGLKVNAFMDDKKLSRGEVIERSILTAIERSRFSVVVFSPGYAGSEWCLDELVKIVRCMEKKKEEGGGHVAMPLFFHVSPDDVAGQTGVYGEAFVGHEKGFRRKRVENWRKALAAVAGISGWCLSDNESEATLVEEISKTIQLKLNQIAAGDKPQTRTTASIAAVVHRMKSSWARSSPTINEANLFSYHTSQNTGIIRVCGLGGLESTNSAKLVYDHVLAGREPPFSRPLTDQNNQPELKWSRKVWDRDDGDITAVMRTNHGGDDKKKVLAIVDDVEKLEALLRLAAVVGWFGSGSRIVLSAVDGSKKVLKVIHIFMEGGGGGDGGECRCLDVACFLKEMVGGGELMKRVVKSLNSGGLPAEIVVKVRIEKFENVEMVENGKLEIVTTRRQRCLRETLISETKNLNDNHRKDDDDRISDREEELDDDDDGSGNGTLMEEKLSKKSQRPRVMEISFLMFAFAFVVSKLGPGTGRPATRFVIANRAPKFSLY